MDEQKVGEQIARCRLFFFEYCRFVRQWEMLPHQRTWFSALQALADGVLRHPESGSCEPCQEIEERWLTEWRLPYSVGFRAVCGECLPTNKLMVLAFFGSGKSDTLIEWMEWLIGRGCRNGLTPQAGWVSYNDPVADVRSVAIRDTIEYNPFYKLVFPMCVPAKKKGWGEGEWFLKRDDPGKKDPTFKSAGVSAGILAYRFPTAVVMDDPQDPSQIRSETYREDTWRVWKSVISSRAAQGVTPMVLIANRHAEDDLPGRLLQVEKDWRVIITPAWDEFEETVFGPQEWQGTPIGVSTEYLHKLQTEDPPAFDTGYLCLPPSAQGDVFRGIDYENPPDPSQVLKVIQFWDTATTTKTQSSYTAMAEFWKLKNGRSYLNYVINVKKSPGDIMDLMVDEYVRATKMHSNVLVLIESAQAGPAFADSVYKNSGLRVRLHSIPGPKSTPGRPGRRGQSDLYSRSAAVAKHVETGQVYLPRAWAAWKDDFKTQLMAFPNAGFDDMVAAFVGGLEYLYPHVFTQMPKITVNRSGW